MKSKRIRELQQLILSKSAEMETALTGETKDIAKAESLNDEITGFEREINVLNAAISREKAAVPDEPVQKQKTESIEKAFADAARSGFRTKAMNETTGADGGYTVPEDIQTRIEQFRDAKFSLRQLVAVENVTTKSGRRTFKKRAQQTGFAKVAEGGKMTRKASPQFQIMEYTIEKYMGYLPVTNELLADSDANITNTIVEWLGDEARVTDNCNIIAEIKKKTAETFASLDSIEHAFVVTLGQAFLSTSALITNDDGLFWLSTLKDEDGRKLLAPDPQNTMQARISVGTTFVPIRVIPNADWSSAPAYAVTADTTVTAGKTYYTRTGSGTAESPYVYTEVAEPTGNPKTSGYYEISGMEIPIVCGDLKEGIKLFDRQQITLRTSTEAVVGSGNDTVNAFEQDMTIFAGHLREDVETRDPDAFVYGTLTVTA